jgi:hypothetical protein
MMIPDSIQAGHQDNYQFVFNPKDPERALRFRCDIERSLAADNKLGIDPLTACTVLAVAGLLLVFGSPELVVINLSNSAE